MKDKEGRKSNYESFEIRKQWIVKGRKGLSIVVSVEGGRYYEVYNGKTKYLKDETAWILLEE
jgi:hypothetical protein